MPDSVGVVIHFDALTPADGQWWLEFWWFPLLVALAAALIILILRKGFVHAMRGIWWFVRRCWRGATWLGTLRITTTAAQERMRQQAVADIRFDPNYPRFVAPDQLPLWKAEFATNYGQRTVRIENVHWEPGYTQMMHFRISADEKLFIFDGPAISSGFGQMGHFLGHPTKRGQEEGVRFIIEYVWQDLDANPSKPGKDSAFADGVPAVDYNE